MDEIRQNTINNLNYLLNEAEIITSNGNSIKFINSLTFKDDHEGEILLDSSKKGAYKIYFVDKLTLILTAIDDFKFANFKNVATKSIALVGDDSSFILDAIKILLIE